MSGGGCRRDTCQVPGCGEPSTDVQWFSYRRCWPARVLLRRMNRAPERERQERALDLLKHLHRCPKHGHVHLCRVHYTGGYLEGEGIITREPLAMAADLPKLAGLEYDHA